MSCVDSGKPGSIPRRLPFQLSSSPLSDEGQCDGAKPSCNRCTQAGTHCLYSKRDRTTNEMKQQIKTLTDLNVSLEGRLKYIPEPTFFLLSWTILTDLSSVNFHLSIGRRMANFLFLFMELMPSTYLGTCLFPTSLSIILVSTAISRSRFTWCSHRV